MDGCAERTGEMRYLLCERELAEIDVIFRGGDEVDELADLGLEGRVVEELEETDVIRL